MFSRFSLLKQTVRHCQPFLFNKNVKKQIFKQCFAATTRRNTKVGGVVGSQLIQVVNKLQDVLALTGAKTEIDLPQIVVCGGQSSGKSSVIEHLVGHDFLPRGRDLVTRCPIILQLNENTENDETFATFLHLGDEQKFDLKDCAQEINRRTNEIAGDKKGIVTQPIVLKISIPNVLPLTLVDMPGLTRVPVGDQPADIEQRIRRLIMRYIQPKNAIILAVHAANQDMATSDALNIAKNADKDCERTVGVLTKIDIMDKGTSPVDMLSGVVYPLRLGWYGIVGRSHEATLQGRSIAESLQHEAEFFAGAKFSSVRKNVGSRNLALRCNDLLATHIAQHLPVIKSQLRKVEKEARSTLDRLGDGVPGAGADRAAQGWYLMHLLNNYASEFGASIDGSGTNILADQAVGGARLRHVFHDNFPQDLDRLQPNLQEHSLKSVLRNASGAAPSLFVPQKAFEVLARQQIEMFRSVAEDCVSSAANELTQIASRVATLDGVVRHAALKRRLDDVTSSLIKDCKKDAKKMVHTIIDSELAYINTNHPNFIGGAAALQHSANLHANTGNKQQQTTSSPSSSSTHKPSSSSSSSSSSSWLGSLFSSTQDGSQYDDKPSSSSSSSSSASNYNSNNNNNNYNNNNRVQTSVEQREAVQVELMKSLLASYFEIVRANLRDLVPKLVMHSLVKQVQSKLQETLVSELYRESEFDFMLAESNDAVRARQVAKEQLEAVEQARDVLSHNVVRQLERQAEQH